MIPHAIRKLTLCATLLSLNSAIRQATAMRRPSTAMKGSPQSQQREKACVQQGRPGTPKIKNTLHPLFIAALFRIVKTRK